jgi:hypothetical protein
VLRPGGQLAVFDGDYNTMSVATGEADPLQACVAAMMQNFLNDPWIVRRLPGMIAAAGFTGTRLRSHGYAQTSDPAYLLSIVDRGTDALVTSGRIGAELGEALKAEARRRVLAGSFFGYIAYASLTASKPKYCNWLGARAVRGGYLSQSCLAMTRSHWRIQGVTRL